MKRKHFWLLLIFLMFIAVAIPFRHLLFTKWKETGPGHDSPRGYISDASGLDLTPIDTLIPAAQGKEALIFQLRSILHYAREKGLKVSLSGARHSMGGHTVYPGGIVVDMLPYKEMHLDTSKNILVIGSGALWEDALYFLDGYGKSIAIMQAFSSFSVGGSVSVNGHGWQKDLPPLASSIMGFSLMQADGRIVHCSREENTELFRLVLGGYGLFGVILDVELQVVDNAALEYKSTSLSPSKYVETYAALIADNPDVELVFGRLRISEKHFLEEATLNYFVRSASQLTPMTDREKRSLESTRLVFRGSVDSEYGKRLRWDLERGMNKVTSGKVFSRNELLNDPVEMIENRDSNSTDILQEYFIPLKNFNAYLDAVKPILKDSPIDLLNITIRGVQADHDSYLNYAREPVFAFVYLFNQKKTAEAEEDMKKLAMALTDVALSLEGSFYLPYRLHVSSEKMRLAYPQADSFFMFKRKYDPEEIFNNRFYEFYK